MVVHCGDAMTINLMDYYGNKLLKILLFFLSTLILLLSFWLDRSGLIPNLFGKSLVIVAVVTLLTFAISYIDKRRTPTQSLSSIFTFLRLVSLILLITYLVYLSIIGYRASTPPQSIQNSSTITFTAPHEHPWC